MCVALLERKLSEFGLCLETDIVGMCMDGAERAFSAAGVLSTKLCHRLDDVTLDTLCFLRAYFRQS